MHVQLKFSFLNITNLDINVLNLNIYCLKYHFPFYLPFGLSSSSVYLGLGSRFFGPKPV